jgi:Dak1 domain
MELGLGIHGEPGVTRSRLQPADQLTEMLLAEILNHRRSALDLIFDKERYANVGDSSSTALTFTPLGNFMLIVWEVSGYVGAEPSVVRVGVRAKRLERSGQWKHLRKLRRLGTRLPLLHPQAFATHVERGLPCLISTLDWSYPFFGSTRFSNPVLQKLTVPVSDTFQGAILDGFFIEHFRSVVDPCAEGLLVSVVLVDMQIS